MWNCPDLSHLRVIVIGDAMLDRYWHGDTSRISPEAPVPIVKIEHQEERVGGAANVALNVQALGATVHLVSIVGDDDAGSQLTHLMSSNGVHCHFIKDANSRTTLKLRVLGRSQQLIRLDFEDKYPVRAAQILEQIVAIDADVMILSDYAKGMLSESEALIDYAMSKGMKVIVDPKNPDLSVYRNATILTPNLSEFEAKVGHCGSTAVIEEKGQALVEAYGLQALLVTRGSQGMSLLQRNQKPVHIPANAKEVFDITGAGDTVIAVLGTCVASNMSFAQAAHLANIAGGISVGRLGTAVVTPQEINAVANEGMQPVNHGSVLTLSQLQKEVQRKKALGQKVVMTNGCFDILHAGHVTYLEAARDLGDCLIIAVNEDESVRRLKGPTRPVNPVAHRMRVLAALGCVDFVIPFASETPQALIEAITPDILVKGGDYEVAQIAGAAHVLAHGGQVKILPFVPGCSTTGMLDRMKESEGEVA